MLTHAHRLLLMSSLIASRLPATGDPFVGKWKFNPDKSILIDEMRVELTGLNKYALNFGGGVENVVADGTAQPGLDGTTVSVTIDAPDSWKIVRRLNGRLLVTGEWKLSADGKTLRDHFTQYSTAGAPSSTDYVYDRAAGTSGFTGSWETSLKLGTFELRIEPWKRDGLALVNLGDAHRTQRLRFDGHDYPLTGPNLIAGTVSSGRRLDERTLEITEKIQGKMSDTRRITLSADHKTLTMTVSPVGRSKPNILVFERE